MLKDAFKSRRFRLWSICVLIVAVSASIVFVIRVARQPSEPFISVNCVRTNLFNLEAISMEVTNRMSFDVSFWTVAETESKVILYGEHRTYKIPAHTAITTHFISEIHPNKRVSIRYVREPKPIEIWLFSKVVWLKDHYPFIRARSFTIYEPDVWVSIESKQPP